MAGRQKGKHGVGESGAGAAREVAPPQEHPPGEAGRDRAPEGDRAEAAPGPGQETDGRLAALEAAAEEHKDRWLRAEAELANFRRRAARELEEAERRARDRVLGEVVSLADDLERALDAAEQSEASGPIHRGVRLVHERVREILRGHGVEVIDPAGQPFDPHVSEALFQVATDEHPAGTVVSVVEKGYRIGERLLRAAKVTVATPAAGEAGPAHGPAPE